MVHDALLHEESERKNHECAICACIIPQFTQHQILYGCRVCRKCYGAFTKRRYIAFLIDLILFFACSYIVDRYLVVYLSWQIRVGGLELETLLIIGQWLIFPFKDGFWGMSPGKWICGIRVIDIASQKPIGFYRSYKRNCVLAIPMLGLLILAFINYDNLGGIRLGDRWAKTKVIWLKHKFKKPFQSQGLLCSACGYNLTGNISGQCPECGELIPDYKRSEIAGVRQNP